MRDLMIDRPENRERLLKACRDYEKLRKGTLSQEQENKPSQGELGLSDGNTAPKVEYL